MAKSPLILAALAKDAVPQLDFVQAMPLTLGHGGHFDSAVLTTTDGKHYVIRQANNVEAELELDTEAVVLRALSPLRSHFPFEITRQLGETKDAKGKRALLYTYVYGEPIDFTNRPGTSVLSTSIANALAAIHSLPLSVVENNGLPAFTAEQIIRDLTAELDRFAQTGRISAVLLNRWERALEDVNIWRFQPTVIHGSANLNNFLVLDEGISAVLGWHTLKIGDPATDFAMVQGIASDDFSYSTLLEYEKIKGADQNFRARAQLYAEFDLGRYLIWALAHDASAIADAQKYLDDLVADIEAGLVSAIGPKPLGTDSAVLGDAGFMGEVSGGFVESSRDGFLGGADSGFAVAYDEATPLQSPVGLVEAGQAIVSDDLLVNPLQEERDPTEANSGSMFAPIVDSSYNHKNLFGETGPIPQVSDATAPIEIVGEDLAADSQTELVDDATAPITLPKLDEPKAGDLF